MRIYEELFIIRPDAVEEEIEAYVEQVKNIITSANGTIGKLDKWGTRKLAYKIGKYAEGFYVLIQFTSGPELPKELERRLKVSDLVIKFVTVRIDLKLKKLEKRTKQREKRAKRKPRVETPAPSAPTAAVAPGTPIPGAPAPGVPAPAEAAPVAAAAEPTHAEPAPAESAPAAAPEAAEAVTPPVAE